MKAQKKVITFIISLLAFFSCKNENEPVVETNTLRIEIQHTIGNSDIEYNKLIYLNAAGNPYEVTEIMYFISDLRLYSNGIEISPDEWNDIYYVDSKLQETMKWKVGLDIPEGTYDSIKFRFGLSEERNESFLFVNPPEVLMAWPEVLGGGFHYLMINGFWKDTMDIRNPYNFHLGIGQIYEENSGEIEDIMGFIDNSFDVVPSGQPFTINKGKVTTLTLKMDVNSWFESPFVFNFNTWGGAIMQNQDAMNVGCLNGRDVFSYSTSEGLPNEKE